MKLQEPINKSTIVVDRPAMWVDHWAAGAFQGRRIAGDFRYQNFRARAESPFRATRLGCLKTSFVNLLTQEVPIQKFSFSVAAATAFVATALVSASTATAVSTGGGNAADTMAQLRAMGYSVQTNGSVPVPLSERVTTAVHGAPSTADASDQPSDNVPFTTVYVDMSGSDDY